MNFITFSADATILFPAANTTTGGQLATEWNLRSREMVSTDPNILYEVGPSFVHGVEDFEVDYLREGGIAISDSKLSIAPGRAVINGHYVETLTPMVIDIMEANNKLVAQSRAPLKGKLSVGIRTFYATEQTVAGTILVEDENDMYLGIQIVVLPSEEMKTPSDTPTDSGLVTADLILAEFNYTNNTISNIVNLDSKLQYIDPERVKDIDEIVSSKYVTKTGLNSKRLYAFAGKGSDPGTGLDTWEDVTDSIIIWDKDPIRTTEKTSYKQAEFVPAGESVFLVLPHKPVYGMTTDLGEDEYYEPRIMELPRADYASDSPGIISSDYTKQIKDIANKINDFRNSLTGKQIMFMDTRTVTTTLPIINEAHGWGIGDYILVRHDEYVMDGTTSTESAPATLYVILPGPILSLQYATQVDGSESLDPGIPELMWGAELGYQEWYESAGQSEPDTENPQYYPQFYDPNYPPRGIPYNGPEHRWYDYFRLRYYRIPEEGSEDKHPFTDFYYGVYNAGPLSWSDPVMLTGTVALATESVIGGFYNASSQATDHGYVRLDDTGHLRLIDYELLRSGTLAYQLSEDLTLPNNITLTETQNYLYEYVNGRIAFPSGNQLSDVPSVIHIYIPLINTADGGVIEIEGIDSRFNTAVCLHIQGDADSNVTVNIRDCEKLIIDPSIGGYPVINIYRCCLKYDPLVFQYVRTCNRDTSIYGTFTGMQDISLWYAKVDSTDPNITVNDMTVTELDSQIISADINYWRELDDPVANDNEYIVALRSITFDGYGNIIGCEILAANNSTDNIETGDKIVVGSIVLPQGSSLVYPIACLTRQLKIDGQFTTAYLSGQFWYVTDTSMTLLTGKYDELSPAESITGQVAFHSKTSLVPTTISETSIAGWEPDSYHILSGGAIS